MPLSHKTLFTLRFVPIREWQAIMRDSESPVSALVRLKAGQFFPAEEVPEIIERLNLYGGRNERERVQLAILKLSQGNRDKLTAFVGSAIADYRNVLAYAEYPRRMGLAPQQESKLLQELRDADRRQYLEWLHGPTLRRSDEQEH